MARFRLPLRFSLRTLFVLVTVLGLGFGWLAWQVHFVHERQRIVRVIQAGGGLAMRPEWISQLSSIRRWLGDSARAILYLPEERFSQSDAARFGEYFPEAEVRRLPQSAVDHAKREVSWNAS